MKKDHVASILGKVYRQLTDAESGRESLLRKVLPNWLNKIVIWAVYRLSKLYSYIKEHTQQQQRK